MAAGKGIEKNTGYVISMVMSGCWIVCVKYFGKCWTICLSFNCKSVVDGLVTG